MKNPKQLIIIGGGASIKEGIKKNLWSKIQQKFVIGCNFSMYDFLPTVHTYVDKNFYEGVLKGLSKENREKHIELLKSLPLVVGMEHNITKYDNTIMLPAKTHYYRDVKKNCYKGSLAGLFGLSLGIYLLDKGQIFLLGMDYGELRKKDYEKEIKHPVKLKEIMITDKLKRPYTHYYQETTKLKHRGIGKISHYNTHGRVKKDYKVYLNETKCQIFNVSLCSKIPSTIFPKLSYNQFFTLLNSKKYNQEILRKQIKQKLNRKE